MRIGVPKEVKVHEYRVGLVPSSVRELTERGHEVFVESNAGIGIGIDDDEYRKAGATIIKTAEEIFASTDMIVKVKEPVEKECKMLREDQILFTFLHLAPDVKQTDLLMKSGCVAIAYETVTDKEGRLPLLTPMSEVAGRMSIQVGAHCLEKTQGGSGVLLGGIAGVKPAEVLIIGGGVVGVEAIRMAIGLEAYVTVLDTSLARLRELDLRFGTRLNTICSTTEQIEKYVAKSDLVVGAVLVPGAAAPKLVTKEMVKNMKPGSVMVDVAIDQGGCFATSHPTTHAEPTYVVGDVVHYCVTNMPGAAAKTSALGLNNATLPYVIALANKGYRQALLDDSHLLNGLNICHNKVTYKAVAEAQNKPYTNALTALQLK